MVSTSPPRCFTGVPKVIEGIHIKDAPGFLATIYPALLNHAKKELENRDQPASEAEDVTQWAITAWLEVCETEDRAYSYMRSLVRNAVRNLARQDRPESLDAQRSHEL